MFICPFYERLQMQYLPYLNEKTECDKWNAIFGNHGLIKKTAIYITETLKKRANCVYVQFD